jgi:hypothetical protein
MPLTPRFHYASAIIERLGYCFHILMPYWFDIDYYII